MSAEYEINHVNMYIKQKIIIIIILHNDNLINDNSVLQHFSLLSAYKYGQNKFCVIKNFYV